MANTNNNSLEFPGGKITLTDAGQIKVEFEGWWVEADPLTFQGWLIRGKDGLRTDRRQFAAMLMQGLLSHPTMPPDGWAKMAVLQADELLKELAKS